MIGKRSPWGKIDYATLIAEGITHVSTPSHGGYHLSRKRLNAMPRVLRAHCADGAFFEEDCCWCAVPISFPECFDDKTVAEAERTLRNWFPDAYEAYFSTTLKRGESFKRDEEIFKTETRDKFVVVSASNHPNGKVQAWARCEATREEKIVYVEPEKYAARGRFGYVLEGNE